MFVLLPQWTSTLRCPCVSLQLPSPWTCAWTLTNNSSSSSRCPSSLHLVSSRLGWLGLVRLVALEALRCATSSYSRSFWHWSRSSRSSGRYSSPSFSDSTSSCLGSMRPSCRSTLRFVYSKFKIFKSSYYLPQKANYISFHIKSHWISIFCTVARENIWTI